MYFPFQAKFDSKKHKEKLIKIKRHKVKIRMHKGIEEHFYREPLIIRIPGIKSPKITRYDGVKIHKLSMKQLLSQFSQTVGMPLQF